jgi:hypothetical protein
VVMFKVFFQLGSAVPPNLPSGWGSRRASLAPNPNRWIPLLFAALLNGDILNAAANCQIDAIGGGVEIR